MCSGQVRIGKVRALQVRMVKVCAGRDVVAIDLHVSTLAESFYWAEGDKTNALDCKSDTIFGNQSQWVRFRGFKCTNARALFRAVHIRM